MKRFEYACLYLNWAGSKKGIYVVQYGETKVFSLGCRKKLLKSNHYETFNKVVGVLGLNGWELTSISTLTGSDYSMMSHEHSTQSEAQEFWFKREIYEEKLPTIEESLSEFFPKDSHASSNNEPEEKLRKQKNAELWSKT